MGGPRPERQVSRRNRSLPRPRCDPPGGLLQGFAHRLRRACRMPRHGPRHNPQPPAGTPSAVAGRYQSEISSRTREGQFPLHGRSGGEVQTFANIIRLEIRVLGKNFSRRQSAGQHSEDRSNRNSYVPNARDAAHLRRINRDAFEILHCCPSILSQVTQRRAISMIHMIQNIESLRRSARCFRQQADLSFLILEMRAFSEWATIRPELGLTQALSATQYPAADVRYLM